MKTPGEKLRKSPMKKLFENTIPSLPQIMKRLRFGIGRPADKSQVVQYVLGDFRSSEVPIVQETVGKCVDVLLELLQTETETKEKHERLESTQMVGEES